MPECEIIKKNSNNRNTKEKPTLCLKINTAGFFF